MNCIKALIPLAFLTFQTAFASPLAVEKEQIYNSFTEQLAIIAETPHEGRQAEFDALVSQILESDLKQNLFSQAMSDLVTENPKLLSRFQVLRLHQLPSGLHLQLFSVLEQDPDVVLEIKLVDAWNTQDENLERKICSFSSSEDTSLIGFFSRHDSIREACSLKAQTISPPSTAQIKDLLFKTPDARDFQGGKYFKKPKIFQLCRTHRYYTCQMVIQDGDGRWLKNPDGTIWSQAKLSLSKAGKAYNEFSGDTPAGLYTIEGVMPTADNQIVFGRVRRLIMEFIPPSKDEATLKSLLPESHSSATWWLESTTARDMGRDLFRIHGTLRINDDPNSTYYPFYPTAGCVASKEGVYDGVDHLEQRPLLDALMTVSNLQPIYENETQIFALFYVVEINSEKRAVNGQDLESLGLR
jgi:hypothetical protein